MSGVQTVAGSSISISAAAPATYDATGYAALTFTKIGEITDGGEHGLVFAEVTHSPIDTRTIRKFKGSKNLGNQTLQLAVDTSDPGQLIARAALESDNDYSIKVTWQDGDIEYYRAKVMSFPVAMGGVDTIRSATINLGLTTNKAGVGIIYVPAV